MKPCVKRQNLTSNIHQNIDKGRQISSDFSNFICCDGGVLQCTLPPLLDAEFCFSKRHTSNILKRHDRLKFSKEIALPVLSRLLL